jgi:2-hydroxy-3-keto-5-methylthiopentenyl-1-phosphate phosphatase
VKLVLDWDGTATAVDTLWLLLERFGDRDVFERVEEELVRGEISYRELMEVELATVRAPLDEVVDWLLEHVRLRRGFHELAARYRPLILSSGFVELIRPVLAREGVELEVAANRLDPAPTGWRLLWRQEAACGTCGDWCKRSGLPLDDRPLVYVGDGYSDRCAALACDRVFAIDGLSDYLAERGIPFERFDDLADVAAALA